MMFNDVNLTPGMRIICRDAEWLITRVDVSDEAHQHKAISCVGIDDLVRGHEARFLTQLDGDSIKVIDPRETKLITDISTGYRLSKLFLEAQLRQMPFSGIDPDFTGMGAFRLMKFQEDTVRLALGQLRPRLLLADAVGLGKTIQVGMIITELMRRKRANRILVLAKKSMLAQFQSELWNRFNIPLVRLDSAGIAKLRLRIPANKNPFEVYHRVIISIDTLKNVARFEHFLKDAYWDVVVIDEAHNVAGASVPERHLSHRLARLLSRRTDSLLLTTATPHNGKRETFGRLISLLDPSTIPDPALKEYTAEDIKGFFLMRFKEDVRNDAGDLLVNRVVIPLAETTIDATPQEEEIYETFSRLRQSLRESYTSDGKRSADSNYALLQYGYYKQFLSSPESCRSTIDKRFKRLRDEGVDNNEMSFLEKIREQLHDLTLPQTSRFRVLLKQLQDIGWNGSPGSPRVLIFTEYRNTQDMLAESLAKHFNVPFSSKFENQPNQIIASIHGSTPDIYLMKTVEAFATASSPIRLMVATDVASEGINLHHECHHIIHFDLPWSIITLIQRNGRIDRLGQKHPPVMRYLMVNTKQGLLQGDEEIFQRLIDKVEVINELRCSGESVLKLYDPQAEEEYIARQGILSGNVNVLERVKPEFPDADLLESIIQQASINSSGDLEKFLFGDADTSDQPPLLTEPHEAKPPRIRLYSDRQFLIDGYRHLAENNSHYPPLQEYGDDLIAFTAPKDLKRRLGAPDERGDIIYGSTAIPEESWPEDDAFRLTSKPESAELSILAARKNSGYWAREQLCNDQHPIMQWISERLVMLVRRGEAPYILSQTLEKGELCFCFVGQVSSKAGTPLIVNAHAISFRKGGGFAHCPLKEALDAAKFDRLVNTGEEPNLDAAKMLISSAVEESLQHMRNMQSDLDKKMVPLLRKEERRLRQWKNSRKAMLEQKIDEIGQEHTKANKYRDEINKIEDYIRDREKNWRESHFMAASDPTTQLILVIGGKK